MTEASLSPSRADLLIQNITDYAIYMLDPEGIVSSWNVGAARLKGYAADEIIGQHFSRFYSPEDLEKGIPALALRTALEEGRFEAEGWRMRKDGSRFWANVVIDPIRDEHGNHVGFAKITRDLTERKEAQEALERSREQLFHAQKIESIGQLTGGVAHDFNNILAAILGSLNLARRRLADGQDITRFLDNAALAAQRGATLTQRMLAFARKQELEIEPVDLSASVRDMAELLNRTIGPGVSIKTSFPLNMPTVMADSGQLELALINLVVNARDAMPGGGEIVLGAEVEPEAEDGTRFVRVSVTDEGEGMDPETLARATEPFFTTKGVGRGTGLGLSMVLGMVEQCGGRLVLKSTPGEGTRAEIWLPAADTEARKPEEHVPLPKIRKLRVLAVDDDPIVLLNTATVLADMGHEVKHAESADAAIGMLAADEFDLLITDFAMPRMTGGELVKRALEMQPDLKVIVVSGYADLPDGEALDWPRLAKPFDETELAHAIAEVVD